MGPNTNPLGGPSWEWLPTNEPRLLTFDGLRCLIYEGSHQNTLVYVEDLTSWSTGGVVTPDQIDAPDENGVGSADLVEGDNSAPDTSFDGHGGTAGGIASMFLKGYDGNVEAHIRAGTFTAQGTDQDITSEWDRYSVLQAGNAGQMHILPEKTLGASDQTIATALGMYAWGANYDPAHKFLLAYIRSAATQADENATFAAAGVPEDIRTGVWGMTVWPFFGSSDTQNAVFASFANSAYIAFLSTGVVRFRANTTDYDQSHGTFNPLDKFEIEVDQGNKWRFRINGGAWNEQAIAFDWSAHAASDFELGEVGSGVTPFYGIISMPYRRPAW